LRQNSVNLIFYCFGDFGGGGVGGGHVVVVMVGGWWGWCGAYKSCFFPVFNYKPTVSVFHVKQTLFGVNSGFFDTSLKIGHWWCREQI